MILDVLAFRNKKMKCYTQPFYTQDKLENQEINMSRVLVTSEEARLKYKSLALYHFGTFDDEKGIYNLLKEPELLFDCDDLIAGISEEK